MTDTSEHLDFNRMKWFVSGIVVASLLDRITSLVLVMAWVIVENKPLPSFLGSRRPQGIIGSFVSLCTGRFYRKKNPYPIVKNNLTTPTQIIFTGQIPSLANLQIPHVAIKSADMKDD